jgi:hypothetical protein
MLNTILFYIGIAQAASAPPDSLRAESGKLYSCVTNSDVPYDCDEERAVVMRILYPGIDAFEPFSSRTEQVFIVWCEDYWSGEHQTSYALLTYHPSTADEQITPDELARTAGRGTFLVRRSLNCDRDPIDGWRSLDCDNWDCDPECCWEIAPFVDPATGVERPVDSLKDLGTLPCFVLLNNPLIDDSKPN